MSGCGCSRVRALQGILERRFCGCEARSVIKRRFPLLGHFGRVIAFMGKLQVADADVRIDFGGLQVGMAQHGLDIAHVAAVFQQDRGERMPEQMTASGLADFGFLDDLMHLRAEPAIVYPLTDRIEE